MISTFTLACETPIFVSAWENFESGATPITALESCASYHSCLGMCNFDGTGLACNIPELLKAFERSA
jgi:hypothetical protein